MSKRHRRKLRLQAQRILDALAAERRMHAYGVLLGYPRCCSDYFAERMATFERGEPIPSMLGEAWIGTGFIPCEAHQAQIREGGMDAFVAEHIAPNRIHPYPFPEEGGLFDA